VRAGIAIVLASLAANADTATPGPRPAPVFDGVELCARGDSLTRGDEPASRIFERALKFYENENYVRATFDFNEVMRGRTGDGAATVERAAFHVGKALFQRRFYYPSLSCFRSFIRDRAAKYHLHAIQWLLSLASILRDDPGVAALLAEVRPEELDAPKLEVVRGLGLRMLAETRSDEEGLRLLARVPDDDGDAHLAAALELSLLARIPGAAAGVVRRARERAGMKKWDGSPKAPEFLLVSAALAFARCDLATATRQLAAYRGLPPGADPTTGDELRLELKRLEGMVDIDPPWRGWPTSELGRGVREDLDRRMKNAARDEAARVERRRSRLAREEKLATLLESLVASAGKLDPKVRAEQRCR
jgi:hypothetical protein